MGVGECFTVTQVIVPPPFQGRGARLSPNITDMLEIGLAAAAKEVFRVQLSVPEVAHICREVAGEKIVVARHCIGEPFPQVEDHGD